MWSKSTQQTWMFLRSHDRAQLRILPGFRNAVGVVLAILIGVLTGNVLTGVGIGIGAQVAGFAGLNGTARRRTRTMLFAAFWMGVTTLIGAIVGGTWWAVVAVIVMGFLAGLLTCVSNEAGLIGLWATIALIFMSGLPSTHGAAPVHALFVFAGALLQTVVMIVFDLLSPSNAETIGVADVYKAISVYATAPSRTNDLQVAAALLEADARLRDSFFRPVQWQRLRKLLDLAESIRIETVALNGIVRSMDSETDEHHRALEETKKALRSIGILLSEIAGILRPRKRGTDAWERTMNELDMLSQSNNGTLSRDWKHAYVCIAQAYSDLEKAGCLARQHRPGMEIGSYEYWVRSPLPQLHATWEAIRVNLTFQSATFRHAVRLAAALGVATIIYQFLPYGRGYWLPLTTLIILKPEFTTTVSRGVARVLGTLVGSVLATFLVKLPDPTHTIGLVLIGFFLWGMYTFLNYNMVLFSCILTAEVVVLVSFFQHMPVLMTIGDRALWTVAGGALALLAYIVWPTWQQRNVPRSLANFVAMERRYLHAILENDNPEAVRKQTRLVRTNAFTLANQAVTEPVRGTWEESEIQGMLTALHRFSAALLSLESYLAHDKTLLEQPEVRQFGAYVDKCLKEVESAIAHPDGKPTEGILDTVSPFTKQQLLNLNVPASFSAVLVRLEANLSTMFRMVAAV